MCTVTVVPIRAPRGSFGYRLVCNRDESVSRPEALPPRRVRAGARRGLMPLDPLGGGTWIGVGSSGLSLALLNRSVGPAAPARPRESLTRGAIIPALLAEGTTRQVARAARGLPLGRFAPFRLVAVDFGGIVELRWDGVRLRTLPVRGIDAPALFASSGLGDRKVARPRGALFARLLAASADGPTAQDRLHSHAWPDRPHLSVMMSRPGARTVSRTTLQVGSGSALMIYEPLPEGEVYNRARAARHRAVLELD